MLAALDEHLMFRDGDGRVVIRAALLATVYVLDPYTREVREAFASCCEDYFAHCGQHLRWAMDPEPGYMERFGSSKGSRPGAWLPDLGEENEFNLLYHGAEDERGASPFFLEALGDQRRPFEQLGYLRLAFPMFWFVEHSGSLVDVLLQLCRKLKPVSGYGGFGVIESHDRSISQRYAPKVYQLAQRFPGLEVDYPTGHSLWQLQGGGGIKGVNWLTVVGDRWLARLGGADAVQAALASLDTRFVLHRFEGGIIIQAGQRPEMGDAERNVWPALYVKLAKYLKPIRITEHRPFQQGGAGLRFDKERSEAWLRRFDDR